MTTREEDMKKEPTMNDIDEMYKMEGTMNEVDKLVSRTIEIVEDNGEIRRWVLDTRPVEEMSSRTLLKEMLKLKELGEIIYEKTQWRKVITENQHDILDRNFVTVEITHTYKNHAADIGYREYDPYCEEGHPDLYTEYYVNGKSIKVCWRDSVNRPGWLRNKDFTMQNVINYINEALNKAEEVYPVIDFIEQQYDQMEEYYKINDFVVERIKLINNMIQFNFDSIAVWSSREFRTYQNEDHTESHVVHEIKLQERKDKRGYVAYFTKRLIKPSGACYSVTPMMLFVTEIGEGEGKRVRLLWKYKNKVSFEKIPPAYRMSLPLSKLYEFLNKLYTKEQVLPIMKYMNLYTTREDQLDDDYTPLAVQLHGVGQSAIHWIGDETSVKKIMAKAYGKSGVEGLTKRAFGGFNNLNTVEWVVVAARFVRAFRAMKPQFFEDINITSYTDRDYDYLETGGSYDFRGKCSIREIEDYIKYFNTKAFQDMFTSENWTKHQFSEIAMTVSNFKRIRSTKLRTAIRNHVKRSNFNVAQTLEFVTQEMHKTKGSDVAIKTKHDKYNGHKINNEITVVMPKKGSDLVAWGAVQNNYIGSYVDRVADGKTSIFGFKDNNNNWIAHVEIKNNKIEQLLGKHNSTIASEYYQPIIKWLRSINVNTSGNFWGGRR